MSRIIKPDDLSFDLKQSPIPEFVWHTSQNLSRLFGSKRLQMDVRSLDPGKFSYPYHFHRNAEELFVLLSGGATLRTPDGFIAVTAGDILFFEIGPTGAHQLYNHTEQPCVFLDIRTLSELDVCEYPDSGKINILPPNEVYRSGDQVDYFLDEEKVREKWPEQIVGQTK